MDDVTAGMSQLKHSYNKYYTLTFRYTSHKPTRCVGIYNYFETFYNI